MTVQPKLLEPTRGDLSNAAATAQSGPPVTVAEIKYASPSAAQPENPIGGVGDQLFGSSVAATLTGGTELTVLPTDDPADCYRVFKLSPTLSPVVDAFVVNVYSAGFTFQPVIEPDRPNAMEKVRQALAYLEAAQAGSYEHISNVTDTAVKKELKRIRNRIFNEAQFLRAWFSRCCPGSTYHKVSSLLGMDLEIQGDSYLEILRDASGFPAKMIWAPAWSIRAKPQSDDLILTTVPVQITDYAWSTEIQQLRFRSYVQVDTMGEIVARYKEYGDPRCMSRLTGKYYWTLDFMYQNPDEWRIGPDNQQYPPQAATELLHFDLPNPLSTTYGKSGYTGIYPVLDGARDLEEENQTLITDRKIPQMFILVSGGPGITQEDLDGLTERLEQNSKEGKKSFYIIQARSGESATGGWGPTPNMEIVKTKSEQYQDALGLQYLTHGEEQVGHAYRLPRAARGQHKDLKEGEAQAAYQFAESQVYDPRRDLIDDRINATLVRDLGIQLVKYKTRSRIPKEPDQLAKIINTLMTAGVLTPDEGRALAGDIFNTEFQDLVGIWSKLPTKLLTAMLQTKNQLVAAALLGSETETDIVDRLQEALVSQLSGAAKPDPAVETPVGEKDPKFSKKEDPDADKAGDGAAKKE